MVFNKARIFLKPEKVKPFHENLFCVPLPISTFLVLMTRYFLFQVAIKIIDMNNIKDDYVRRNLFREAKLLRKLSHPNIIKLYETIKVLTH